MKLLLSMDTNCVGCMTRYLHRISQVLMERITDPAERPEDGESIILEQECDIACDGYEGSVTLDAESNETWEEMASICSLKYGEKQRLLGPNA